jgi:hypothetical protein
MSDPTKEYTFKDVLQKVDEIDPPKHPSLKYFQDMDIYFEDLRRALKVINEYKNRDAIWEPSKMVQDAIFLSAMHSSISELVGFLQSNSSRTEDSRKHARSQYVLSIKQSRDAVYDETGQFVKMTEKEIDDASRVLSKQFSDTARDAEAVSRIITNAWYSVEDFCRILQTAINRANREQALGG